MSSLSVIGKPHWLILPVSSTFVASKLPRLQLLAGNGKIQYFEYEVEGKTAAVKWANETVYEPEERVVQVW